MCFPYRLCYINMIYSFLLVQYEPKKLQSVKLIQFNKFTANEDRKSTGNTVS